MHLFGIARDVVKLAQPCVLGVELGGIVWSYQVAEASAKTEEHVDVLLGEESTTLVESQVAWVTESE